jgi:hypothetical protein
MRPTGSGSPKAANRSIWCGNRATGVSNCGEFAQDSLADRRTIGGGGDRLPFRCGRAGLGPRGVGIRGRSTRRIRCNAKRTSLSTCSLAGESAKSTPDMRIWLMNRTKNNRLSGHPSVLHPSLLDTFQGRAAHAPRFSRGENPVGDIRNWLW